MENLEFDVLIIGTGLGGLASAFKLAQEGAKIGIVTRASDSKQTNTYWAQGGIIYPDPNDKGLDEDIQKASSNTSNPEAIAVLRERSREIFDEVLLNTVKTAFETDQNGKLKLTKEAAHSSARIVYDGDHTGRTIGFSMIEYLNDEKKFPNITVLKGHTAIDLISPTHHGVNLQQKYGPDKIVGAYLLETKTGKVLKVMAKNTIMATGGIAALYLHHSNSEASRGDGHAMALRAGARLINMEYIQFHPTTFYDRSTHQRFLVTEAIRGEGGRLINSKGEYFMSKYHPDEEMAPRDVVARAIQSEMLESKEDCVYLDISHKDPNWVKTRFPTIYEHCLKRRIDITVEPIPVVPAAHYSCGGIKTDMKGRTNLNGLYAVGEVACTGLHGANRLASVSLLECLTFGYIAAEDILEDLKSNLQYDQNKIKDWETAEKEFDMALINQDWLTLKQTMWNYVGLIRSNNRLKRADAMLRELNDEVKRFYRHSQLSDSLIGLRNACEVARVILTASSRNKESIGCFFRVN